MPSGRSDAAAGDSVRLLDAEELTELNAAGDELGQSNVEQAGGPGDAADERAAQAAVPTALKRWQTAAYCTAFVALGLNGGMLGPTLLMLARNCGVDQSEIASVFAPRGIAFTIGCFVSGKLYERYPAHPIVAAALLLMALLNAAVPFVSLWPLLVLHAAIGFAASALEVGCNALVYAVWQLEANAYMQFLHFCFGLGAALSPFVVGAVILLAPTQWQLAVCYVSNALLLAAAAVVPACVSSPALYEADEGPGDAAAAQRLRMMRYLMVGATAVFLAVYVGAESSYGAWVFAYVVEAVGLPEAEAAYIVSAFWFALTVGRLMAVPIALRVSSRRVLLCDIGGCLCAVLLLLAADVLGFLSRPVVWIGSVMAGGFMASVFATAYSYPAEAAIRLSPRECSVLAVATALGDIAAPSLLGVVFGFVSARLFPFFILALVLSFALAFIVLDRTLAKLSLHLKRLAADTDHDVALTL
eukprot:TRINITY_DN2351_c0_g1_i1.p2 TRINITY_DN2351_c0_g1~~TRINITY_DN2351_c0_g1_i1.p2  ORF type:complete len:472 (-),score=197.48 TRINITY_DN2351_c0_g1_i1:163-1578(-)